MTEDRVYVVQVSRQAGRFRASVRDVLHEQPLWFDEAASLARFLVDGSRTAAPAAESMAPSVPEPGRPP